MKQKMSNFKFRAILIPIIAFFLVLIIGVTCAAEFFAPSLDTYLGRGDRVVVGGGDYSEEDTDYYGQKFPRSQQGKIDASYAAYQVAEELSDEGEVLLKNDGTLPLQKGEKAGEEPLTQAGECVWTDIPRFYSRLQTMWR